MFNLIFQKELRDIIQSSRFTISFAVCSVLIILAFFMGAQNYLASQAQYEASLLENKTQIAGNTDWNMISHNIMLPPNPLMALVNGISNDIGRNIFIREQGELTSSDSRFNDEPIFAIFRFMDLEFIFGIVLSLFALIFAYDAINGEKVRGTLKLCFSNSVSRAEFIAGKLAGSFVGLSLALTVPLVLGCLLLPFFGIHLSGDEWIKLGLIILAGIGYFGIFLAAAIAISAATNKPSNAFLIGLILWICTVLILPRASVLISGRLVEVPNIDNITAQKQIYTKQLLSEDISKMNSFNFDFNSEESFSDQFVSFMSDLGDKRQKKIDVLTKRLNEEYTNKRRLQEQLAINISRISPTSVFTLASTTLAGTSLKLQNDYMDAAYEYQHTYENFMIEKTGFSQSIKFSMKIVGEEKEKSERIDPNEIPEFTFEGSNATKAASESLLDFGLLFLFNLLFFGIAYMAFQKYDIR